MSHKLIAIFLFLLIFTACSRTPAPDAAAVVDTAATASSPATEPPPASGPTSTPPPAETVTAAPTEPAAPEPPATEPSATEPSATATVAGVAPLTLSLSAEPEALLSAGECTTLTWEVTGAAAVWLYAETESFAQNIGEHAGSAEFCPAVTTTYELRAQAAAGPPRVEQVVVTVVGSAETPAGAAAEPEPTAAGAAAVITGANPLGGSLWQVSAINGTPVIPGTVVAALFGRDGTVNVNGGCNTFIGSYQAGSDAVAIGTLPAPTLSCGDALQAQEQALVTALQASAVLEQVDGQLVFRDAAGGETVRFRQP